MNAGHSCTVVHLAYLRYIISIHFHAQCYGICNIYCTTHVIMAISGIIIRLWKIWKYIGMFIIFWELSFTKRRENGQCIYFIHIHICISFYNYCNHIKMHSHTSVPKLELLITAGRRKLLKALINVISLPNVWWTGMPKWSSLILF